MRVFLSEYLTSGAFPAVESGIASLAIEGAAMLRALAEDVAAIPNCQVEVTWDRLLPPFGVANAKVHLVGSIAEENSLFRTLAHEADATIIIAPEFDQILESRCRIVGEVGGRLVGSTTNAISLCSDKFALANHLQQADIPTIPTRLCDFTELKRPFTNDGNRNVVVKPRYGAGSVDTFFIRSARDIEAAAHAFGLAGTSTHPIVQPFIPGEALSIAAIVANDRIELFPICRQHIETGGQLHYAGGCVPASTRSDESVHEVARRAIAAVPGLSGYIGVDIILPAAHTAEQEPLIVEINPRLTSSYHGYRRLSNEKLAERLISPDKSRRPISWGVKQVQFHADGTTKMQND